MSIKIHNAEISNNYLHFGDLQILFLQGTVSSGAEIRINFPCNFLDDKYIVAVTGNYGSQVNVANKYKDCIFINVANNGQYNTGKYEIIAIGKWR